MASAGSKAASGAASGAAAGAALGPWGALAGGVIGGIGGYLQGDDPRAPIPVMPPPPQLAGGYSSQFGGAYIDPVTKRVVYTDNTSDAEGSAAAYQNAIMRQMLLGGNGAELGIADQIKAQQQLIERLKNPQAAGGGAPKASDFVSDEWIGKDGKIIRPADVGSSADNPGLFKLFMANTGNGNYGKGSLEEKFKRWVADAYKNNVESKAQEYDNALKTSQGNAQTSSEALDAAQRRLDYLTKIQASGAQAGQDFAKNPLMNFLNQRNMSGETPDYLKKYADPWTGKMSDEAQGYLDASHKDSDFSSFGNPSGGGSLYGMQDPGFNMSALLNGPMGGERMAPVGPFQSTAGDFVRNLNRIAERQGAGNVRLAEENASRRGLMGGTSDIARFAAQQGIDDAVAANLARGYEMDQSDRNNWFNQNFAVNQHNSDVARQGAQMKFQSGLAAKQFYEQLRQQAFNNDVSKFQLNQAEKQRNYQNMMGTLGQRTALDQRTIDNARYDQGLDRQNFQDRMGLLGYLSGQSQQGQDNARANAGMGLNQGSLAFGVGNQAIGNQSNWQASNAASQNAYNLGQWQQNMADSARRQQTFNDAMGGLGSVDWSKWGSEPAPYNSSIPSTWQGSMNTVNSVPSSTSTIGTNQYLQSLYQTGGLFPQQPIPQQPKSR